MTSRNDLTLYPTTQRLTEAVGELMRGEGDAAVITPGMMTFGGFERRLRADILGPRKFLGEIGRALLLARVLDDHYRKNAGAFRAASRFPGFGAALLSFFDELGAGLVGPDELDRIEGYAPGKEQDIALLYRKYRDALTKDGYADEGVLRAELIDALASPSAFATPTLSRYGAITLKDIYQFTPYRFELFRLIAKRIPVTIVAPLPDERRKAFGFIVSNMEKFESLAEKEEGLSIEYEEAAEGPLSPLVSGLFDLSREGAPPEFPGDNVSIIKCASRYREVEEVGARILKQREADDAPWSAFGVVFRDLRLYGPIIEDVFNRYAIPFHFRRGVRLSLNPLARSVISLFEAIERNYTRDSVLRMLSSPYFSRFSRMDIDTAQEFFLKAGVIDGPSSVWIAKLGRAIDSAKQERRGALSGLMKETVETIKLLETFSRKIRPSEFIADLKSLTERLGLTPEPDADDSATEKIRFRDHNAYAQLMETVAEAEWSIRKLGLSTAPIGFERTRDILLGQIEAKDVPEPGAANRNRVIALGAHDAIGVEFDHLFVCGLHEGEFPLYGDSGSILHEIEKTRFNDVHAENIVGLDPAFVRGRRVFDRAQDKWREESLLFYQTVKAAKEKLTLTYSAQELNGSPLMRSQFVDDVMDALLPGVPRGESEKKLIKPARQLAIEKPFEEMIDQEERRAWLLWKLYRGGESREPLESAVSVMARGEREWRRFRKLLGLASVERGRDRYFHEPDADRKLELISGHNGLVSDAEELLRSAIVGYNMGRYAPTDLEKYGQCPFRYFASKLLSLEPVREPELELDAREAGSLFHQILEDFYRAVIDRKLAPLSGSAQEAALLDEIAVKVFEDYERQGKQGDPAIWAIEREKTLDLLRMMMNREKDNPNAAGFVPVAVEAGFDLPERARGDDRPNPPHPVGEGDARRLLIGKIDRIDINREKNIVRVVDYKLSSAASRYREMVKRENMGETSFQIPAYIILARRHVLDTGALEKVEKAEGAYRLIKSRKPTEQYIVTHTGKSKGEEVDSANFLSPLNSVPEKDKDKTFESALMRMIGKIEGGRFPVAPRNCDYCDFPALCRYLTAPLSGGGGEE